MEDLNKIEWLKNYIGLQFKDHARGPKKFDCYGLYWYIRRKEFGDLNLPSYDEKYNSYHENHVEELIKNESLKWKSIKNGHGKLGDGIKFRIVRRNKFIWHIGMILNSKYMIHIMEGIDSCVDSYTDKIWRGKQTGIYRPEF